MVLFVRYLWQETGNQRRNHISQKGAEGVDDQESLVRQADAMTYASAMNDDNPPFGYEPMPNNEVGNSDFM